MCLHIAVRHIRCRSEWSTSLQLGFACNRNKRQTFNSQMATLQYTVKHTDRVIFWHESWSKLFQMCKVGSSTGKKSNQLKWIGDLVFQFRQNAMACRLHKDMQRHQRTRILITSLLKNLLGPSQRRTVYYLTAINPHIIGYSESEGQD